MDHYFIIICKDSPTPQDLFVPDYIRSLLPDKEGLRLLSTGCLPIPLLQCNTAYLSVVNFYAKEEFLEWKEIKEWGTITGSLQTVDNSFEAENISKDQIFSSHMNHLADQLPSSGTYKLDVIICYDVLKEFSVSSNIEFAGSLYRLVQWHGAHVVIAAPREIDQSHLKEWLDISGATMLEDEADPTLGALVWRGSVQIQPSNKLSNSFKELQLRLDFSENAVLLDNPVSKATDADTTPSEHLILSSSLSIIDKCNLNTIPPYMVLPFAFRLSSCKSNDSSKLLEYVGKESEAALIARMGYSITTDKPKADKSLSTNMWQKMISSGNIKFPEESLPTIESYVSFIITKSKKSGNIIAYPMSNHSKLDCQFHFSYLNELSTRPALTNGEHTRRNDFKVELPYLTESGFSALVNKLNILKVSMSKKCETDHSSDSKHVCFLSVLESAAKSCGVCSLLLADNTSELLCEEIDPADWPERVHLLQKQMRLEKEKSAAHPILLQNLSPQRNHMNVCFTSEDAMKYFEPSGEGKDRTNVEIISSLYNVKNLTKQDHAKILQTEWPGVMKCKYDDIYYNSSVHAEELESMCNGLVRLYVQHETSCCCNREQVCPDTPILIRARHRESAQKWRSPAKMRTPKKEKPCVKNQLNSGQGLYENSKFGRHGSISDLQSSRLIKKSGSFSSSIEKMVEVGRGRKQLVKSNPLPVRQSPRKKIPVKYSQSSTSRLPKPVQKKLSKSQKLPELSIKKLRVAVAQALEKNDIHADHSFFRPCFKRLFTICQAFVQDLPCKKGRTSEHMQKIADANVKQVIEFEKQKDA